MKSKKQESAKWSREIAVVEKKKREKEVEMNKLKPLFIKAKEQTLHVVKRLEASRYLLTISRNGLDVRFLNILRTCHGYTFSL